MPGILSERIAALRKERGLTQEQLGRQMSYIEQNVFLFNSTIRDNITL